MKIETGEPRESGSYVCYMHGVDVPTVVRFWLIGTGWMNNLKEPVAGTVAGWIGPLPYMNADPVRRNIGLCSTCGKPQFDTPSGITCEAGHGGADTLEFDL